MTAQRKPRKRREKIRANREQTIRIGDKDVRVSRRVVLTVTDIDIPAAAAVK